MAWITLALRKQTLKAEINSLNYEDIQLSRQQRAVHRHLSYEQSVFNTEKKQQLRDAKAAYTEIRNQRPDVKDPDYEQWKTDYAMAQEEYQAAKENIEDYYDDVNSDLEADAQDEEDEIQEQITQVETQRDAMSAELQAISDQIKTEIDNSAIKF